MERRRDPRRYRLSTETKNQNRVHAGVQQGNPAAFVADSLMAQRPLLDVGEVEFQPNSVSMNIYMHTEQEIPQMRETISSHPQKDLLPTIPPAIDASTFSGLEPPRLDSTGGMVTGADTPKHRIENKRRRQATLANQVVESHWTIYKGKSSYLINRRPSRSIKGRFAHLDWLYLTPRQISSMSGPHTAALPTQERHGLLSRCKLRWTGDLIIRLYPTKPLLISGLRSMKR